MIRYIKVQILSSINIMSHFSLTNQTAFIRACKMELSCYDAEELVEKIIGAHSISRRTMNRSLTNNFKTCKICPKMQSIIAREELSCKQYLYCIVVNYIFSWCP